jgi:hypothetical protein
MRFLSRFDDFESIVIDGSVVSSGLSTIYLKDAVNPILRIGNNTGDSFITYDGTELSISSDVDLRLTTPTDQDVFLITSSGNIVTTQGGGTFTIGGGLTLENFGAGYLKTDANGVVSIDTDIIEDTLDSVTDRGATTTNAITVGGLTVDTTTLVVDSANDRVGIGTTSPATSLQVGGTSGSNFITLSGANANGEYGINWAFNQPGTNIYSQVKHNWNDRDTKGLQFNTQAGYRFSFNTINGTGTFQSNLVTVLGSGNVGIGTTNPGVKLQVVSDIEEVIRVESGATGAIHFFNGATRTGILGYSNGTSIANGADADDMVLRAESGHKLHLDVAGGAPTMTIDVSNVGIGTTSPGTKLDVSGTFRASGEVTLSNYGAGLLQTNASGVVSVNTTSYTPTSRSLTINGTAYDLSADRTWTISTITGNAGSATVLQTARTLTIGSTGKTFDGSANVSWTLGEIGAAAASHNHTSLTGITSLSFAAEATDTASITTTISGTSTFFDFNLTDDNNNDEWRWRFIPSTGSLYTAMRLVPVSNTASNLVVSGTISASNFSGSSSGTNTGDQTTITGNAGSATVLQTARTLTIGNTGKSFDGSANVSWTLAEIGAYAATNPAGYTTNTGTVTSVSGAGGYGGLTLTGTVTTSGDITLGGTPTGTWPISVSGSSASTTGNAATATALQTARTINGTSFDGSANITTASWGTARNVTIGSSTKSVDGSANVSFSLAEIGAQAAGSYLTAESDTLATVTGRGATTTSAITVGGLTSTVSNTNDNIVLKRDSSGTIYTYGVLNNAGSDFNINGTGNVFINADSNSDSTSVDRNVTFGNRGIEYMRVRYDGNVGIGTTNPNEKLVISNNGAAGFEFQPSSGRFYRYNRSTTAYAGIYTEASEHTWSIGTSEAMRINTSGNVGIGLTNPTYIIQTKDMGITNSNAWFGTGVVRIGGGADHGSNQVLSLAPGRFGMDNPGVSNGRFIIQESGYVGIGNNVPVTGLDVRTAGYSNTTARFGTTRPIYIVNDDPIIGFNQYYDNGWKAGTSGWSGSIGLTSSGDIYFNTSNNSAAADAATSNNKRMTILNNGNVGINTTAPLHKLHVDGAFLSRRSASTTNINGQFLVFSDSTTPTTAYLYGMDLGYNGNYRTRIFSPASYDVALSSAPNTSMGSQSSYTDHLVVKGDTGNVGIGTIAPDTRLHVVGTAETRLRVGSSNATSNVVLELRDENSPTGQGTVITYNNATGETYFNNALSTATTDFHFQSGEYGTASDFFTLSDAGGNSIVQLSTATGDAFITYEDAINELAIASDGDLRLTTPTDQDVFYISSGGNIDMTQAGGVVDMGGNLIVDGQVGIGTSSPDHTLHVVSSQQCPALFESTTAGGGISLMDSTTTNDAQVGIGAFGDALCFRSGGAAAGNMRLLSNGNLGINTTSALQKLHVSGGHMVIENTYGLYLNGSDTNWQFGRNIVTDSGFLTSNTVQVKVFNGATQGFQVVNSSNTAVFEVEGSGGRARVLGGLAVGNITPSATAGRIDASNDIVAYSTSDSRLKENVTPIENALEKVKALTGVEFDWKEETKEVHGYEGHDVGVIAQEVQAVLPEAVRTTDSGYLSVRYEKMIALLIEGMKEQQVQIDELKAKLDGLTK